MFLQHEFKRIIKRKNEKKEKVKFTIRGESMGKYYYLKSEVFSLNSEKLFISFMSTASYSHDVKNTFFDFFKKNLCRFVGYRLSLPIELFTLYHILNL